jgi:hypothetical protein
MSAITKTQAIKAFLMQFAPKDLAELYTHDMEVQITVSRDNGDRIDGDFRGKQWHGYTDGIQIWKPIRIPINANTVPEFSDSPMSWDLRAHAEGIGMTGWDWKAQLSRWVAFDFDGIVGHSDKHSKKLSDEELLRIQEALTNIPYVTVRRSTGGKGLHLYVFLTPTHTANHNEHAAVARAVLSQLSGAAGFDFSSKVDICGGNMWVWHRKLRETQGEGLKILKKGTELAHVPPNWREYTKVVSGVRTKSLPTFIEDQMNAHTGIEDVFAEITGQRMRIQPDIEHKAIMNWCSTNYPNASYWVAEHHMFVTHTSILKECHETLNLRGKFETLAIGSEKGSDINCYMFPITKGGWSVRRYTLGVAEHPYWQQDGSGWTSCVFNREPNLSQASGIHGGVETKSKGFWFRTADEAQKAALLLGVDLALPMWILSKRTHLTQLKDNRLMCTIEKDKDGPPLPDWLMEDRKYERIFTMKTLPNQGPAEVFRMDDVLRHMVSERGDDCGWAMKKSHGNWDNEPLQNIRPFLMSQGCDNKQMNAVIGASVNDCWILVNMPFREEYPSNRRWNRYAAQLKFKPSLNKDNLQYPTWLKVLAHLGENLTPAVEKNEWCRANSILTGADWLKCWVASLFQQPMEPLPYLFFYGEQQNTGKTSFHEALSLLMTSGSVCRADTALQSSSNFNGELAGAVLAVVEETDLKKNTTASNRIKDWVTTLMLPIHPKGKQPYMIPNSLHFVQCANSHLSCPIFPGDTRITMIRVDEIKPEHMIPKKQLIPMLTAEAPDFLAEILGLELPMSPDRLNVPCLTTDDKESAQVANQSLLEMFIGENTHYAPGHRVKLSEFTERFYAWLDPNHVREWTRHRISREMPTRFQKGRIRLDGQFWIGNISWVPVEEAHFGPRFFTKDQYLMQETPPLEPIKEPATNGVITNDGA